MARVTLGQMMVLLDWNIRIVSANEAFGLSRGMKIIRQNLMDFIRFHCLYLPIKCAVFEATTFCLKYHSWMYKSLHLAALARGPSFWTSAAVGYAPLIISTMDTIVKCLVLQKRVKEEECQPLVPIWWHPLVTLTERHHEFSTRIIVLGNKHSTKTRVCFQ